MKYEITRVQLAPMQVDEEKPVYFVYYNMTHSNTFTTTQLYITAIDELDAYYKASREIEKLIEKREQQDV
jgi:DNA-directed RNA polymerase subunit L